MPDTPRLKVRAPRYKRMQEKALRREIATHESGQRADSIDVSWPTDEIVQLLVYFNAVCADTATGAWLVALAVIELAAQLDRYDSPSYRAFLISFKQALSMLEKRPMVPHEKPPSS